MIFKGLRNIQFWQEKARQAQDLARFLLVVLHELEALENVLRVVHDGSQNFRAELLPSVFGDVAVEELGAGFVVVVDRLVVHVFNLTGIDGLSRDFLPSPNSLVNHIHHHLFDVLMQFDADAFNFRIGVIVPE